MRHSDRVFLIHTDSELPSCRLIETVTFRQSCCRSSSRHRSCFALSGHLKYRFTPSDDSPSAATISQDTTEFSNCWVPPQVDVGPQQLSLLCERWCFLIHVQLPPPRLRDQVLQPNLVLCARRLRRFPAVSRALHQLCRAISAQTAWRG